MLSLPTKLAKNWEKCEKMMPMFFFPSFVFPLAHTNLKKIGIKTDFQFYVVLSIYPRGNKIWIQCMTMISIFVGINCTIRTLSTFNLTWSNLTSQITIDIAQASICVISSSWRSASIHSFEVYLCKTLSFPHSLLHLWYISIGWFTHSDKQTTDWTCRKTIKGLQFFYMLS